MLRKFTLLLSLSLLSLTAVSQVKFNATPTGKHAKIGNTAKKTLSEAKAHKRQIKEYKKRIEVHREYKMEIAERKKAWAATAKAQHISIDSLNIDSVQVPPVVWTREDSILVAEEVLNQSGYSREWKRLAALGPVPYDSLRMALAVGSKRKIDALLEQEARRLTNEAFAGQGELPQKPTDMMPSEATALQQGPEGLVDQEMLSKPNPNLIAPKAAAGLFEKMDPKQFQEMQSRVNKLKQRYESLPDINDLSTGKKRKSLEDLPFLKRLSLGGTFQVASTDPPIIDLNLQLGYWINKNWMAGTSFLLREQFGQRDSTQLALTGDSWGWSVFTKYQLVKGFFAWGEFQRQVNQALLNPEESASGSSWQALYLLGIGRDFKIGPLSFNTTIMYDFNHQNNNVHSGSFVVRLGLNISKKPK